ncbi:MAG: hypothetical protein J2P17_03520, partial [Mycobacterium sp.]|nr:hypothetical protein [Mycobacterium sp.]
QSEIKKHVGGLVWWQRDKTWLRRVRIGKFANGLLWETMAVVLSSAEGGGLLHAAIRVARVPVRVWRWVRGCAAEGPRKSVHGLAAVCPWVVAPALCSRATHGSRAPAASAAPMACGHP